MTDQNEAPDSSDSTEEATDNGGTADAGAVSKAAGQASTSGSRQGIAWFSLVVALFGLAGVGWLAWQQYAESPSDRSAQRIEQVAEELRAQSELLRDQTGRSDEQGQRLEGLVGDLGALRSRLERVAGQEGVSAASLEPLRDSIQSQSRATDALSNEFEALSERVDTTIERVESRLSSLQARRDDRINESLARAEYRLALVEMAGLLRVARTAARSSDDPAAVIPAYEQALSRARGLDDSRVEGLRQTLAGELEALRGMVPTDWAALVGRLAALEAQSADWPMAGQGTPADASAQLPRETDAQADEGWWSHIRRSVSGLVRVTPRAAAPLGPAAAESVRERTRLHLAGAQAAASRHEPEALEPHLAAVLRLIEAHFDPDARAVRQARAVIEDAAAIRPAAWPELGATLAEIERQLGGS